MKLHAAILITFLLLLHGCGKKESEPLPDELRLGYLPNFTHSQALIGLKKGFFKDKINPVDLQAVSFNSGPTVVKALLSGELDLAFVGPVPAIIGHFRSGQEKIRIIAGASSGGVLFITGERIKVGKPRSLKKRRIAVPALNNTQHIALRNYLKKNGLRTTEQGGSVEISVVDNVNIPSLISRRRVDAAWIPEPWATRLVSETSGIIFLNEGSLWTKSLYSTTVLVVRKEFLDAYPALVVRFLDAHVNTTQWIKSNRTEAVEILHESVEALTGVDLTERNTRKAFSNVVSTYDPIRHSLVKYAAKCFSFGLTKGKKVDNLLEFAPLDTLLKHRGLPMVKKLIN